MEWFQLASDRLQLNLQQHPIYAPRLCQQWPVSNKPNFGDLISSTLMEDAYYLGTQKTHEKMQALSPKN